MIMFKSTFCRLLTVLVVITMALSACGKKAKFDRKIWNDGDGLSFPERDAMLEDLLKNHKLKGLSYKQAIQLLHEPQRNSYTDKSFQYEIIRKMDGLDTVFAKTLTLYLSKDSIVTDFKVTEKDNTEKLKEVFKERNKKK